jgi:ribosomal-protein-alanine N-acetyltransferase
MSGREQPTLSGSGLILRPFEVADANFLVSGYSQPSIQQWHVATLTDLEAVEWIGSRVGHWRHETRADWAVTTGAEMVGRIGLKSIDLEEGVAEVSYWILAEHRLNGYATTAVAVLSNWAFDDLGLHRVELTHSTQNIASCRVAERSGYQLEGIKRDGGLHADGWHDMHLHATIAADRGYS